MLRFVFVDPRALAPMYFTMWLSQSLFAFLLWTLQLLTVLSLTPAMLPHTSLYVSAYAQEQCFFHAGFLRVDWLGYRKCIRNFISGSSLLPRCISEGDADSSILHRFLFLLILTKSGLADGFKRELIVLIYIFLTTSKVGSLLCLLAIRFSFSMSCVFISYPLFYLLDFHFY